MKREEFKSIFAEGVTVTTGATTANVAIPVNSAGLKPRYVIISATVESYIRLGGASVAATANSFLVQPADCRRMAVGSATHVAYIQGTTSGKVNITPCDDE